MRRLALVVLGLLLLAVGAQGVIRLVIGHEPGALRHLPGGFLVQLVVWGAIALFGLTMARRNRIHADPEHQDP
jgi:ABC-type Na+ efflux pump permease subunit